MQSVMLNVLVSVVLAVALLTIPIILSNYGMLTVNHLYAQQTGSLLPSLPDIGVKITSPTTGQSVSSGDEQQLQITGSSTDDSVTNCQVSVIANNVKPYQPVLANGSGGINDYSSWSFLLNSSYASIKEGQNNRITAKLVCLPNLTKWYSVNVTGISFNASILKITSPTSYERLSTGKTTIQGTSMDDFYKDCEVLVRKNSLPFQKTAAAGLTGARDYSVWKFAFTEDYASVTPGNTNSLTAKLFCDKNPSSVNNKNNNPDTTYATVNIVGVNQPPVADANADKDDVREGVDVTLDGEDSSDPNGDPLTYLWKLAGDLVTGVDIVDSNKPVASFKIPDELIEDTTFEMTLTVTDKYGEVATDTVSIEAKANSEPVADVGRSNEEAVIGEQVSLDGTDSHDPDPTGQIVSYKWEQTRWARC
ncbi:MAG: PKD domain-containing protein [Nitrososphaeraceae archaeon]